MIKRKIITTLAATPISLFLIFAVYFREWEQPLELVVMTGMFSLLLAPFIILYGVPVTFLSDFVGRRLNGNVRMVMALAVHLIFGMLFGFIFPLDASLSLLGAEINLASISASITAFFFWLIDELLRSNKIEKAVFARCCFRFAR